MMVVFGLSTVFIQRQTESLLAIPLPNAVDFQIPSGATLSEIAATAEQAGVPINKTQFIALAKYRKVAKSLKAGRYRFAAGKNVGEILQDMSNGKVAAEKISIIEGTTFAKLRIQLAQDNRFAHTLTTMDDVSLKREIDTSFERLEGLFLPETYFFENETADVDILRRAHNLLKKILDNAWRKRNADVPFQNAYEALILASIVEKETGAADERGLIASVFINRLKKGIPLQADPTVIYGLGERFKGNITRSHLREDTPYNTYTRRGLPPGPIALVGKAAIEAVLNRPKPTIIILSPPETGGMFFPKPCVNTITPSTAINAKNENR